MQAVGGGNEEEAEDDMFADVEDTDDPMVQPQARAAEAEERPEAPVIRPAAAQALANDSHDDAEGYYNFQVRALGCWRNAMGGVRVVIKLGRKGEGRGGAQVGADAQRVSKGVHRGAASKRLDRAS